MSAEEAAILVLRWRNQAKSFHELEALCVSRHKLYLAMEYKRAATIKENDANELELASASWKALTPA